MNHTNSSSISDVTQPSKNLSNHVIVDDKSSESSLHLKTLFNTSQDQTTSSSNSTNPIPYQISQKQNLRILTTNTQSIRGKKSEFAAMLDYIKPDIVCVTETWLHGKKPGENPSPDWIKDSEIFPSNYKSYRNDRNPKGGGVFILVEKSIIAVEKPTFVTKCEINWVKIHLKGRRELFIGCFYMPHRNAHDLHQLDLSLQDINKTKFRHVILCGDFNCPGIDWETCSLKPGADDPDLQQQLIDISIQHGLTQLTDKPTRHPNILDLCFTTNTSLIKNTSVIPGISDHDIVITDSFIKPHYQKFKKRTVLLFKKANWEALKAKCVTISAELETMYNEGTDMDTMWNSFKSKLNSAINESIPSKSFVQRNDLPWMTKKLKKMSKKKAKLHKQATTTHQWGNYRQFQKECKKAFKKAEDDYTNNIIQQGLEENNPKPFWKFIKSKKQDNVGVSPLFQNGKLESDSKSKAEIFLEQFSSVFTPHIPGAMPTVQKRVNNSLTHINITHKGVDSF